MSVSAVGTRGWAARPWQSKASVSVQSGRLTPARMLDLAAAAARHVQDDRGWVSQRERTSMRVDLRVRDMVRDEGAEVMQCPMFTIHAPADLSPVTAWIERFIRTPADDLVLMTGEGLRRLLTAARLQDREGAFVGALAGVLITPTQYTSFNVGVPFAISGFIAAIVGGFGRPLGALLGGILLGVGQALAVVFLGAAFKNAAALSILLLFLFVRPTGVLGAAK